MVLYNVLLDNNFTLSNMTLNLFKGIYCHRLSFDHKNYLGEVWTSGVDNVSSGQTKGQMVVKDRRADRDTDHWRANGGEGPNNVLEKWFNSVINDYIFFS